ncbi:hypothetical protein KKPNMP14_56830 [Klebsiella pneumoniae subsp. pneumoniae MP14]|nr:hypothetical protein KKPNMP14_56830 [Klebsiella pneumoniae subsp. pneumoniae MP14]
MNIAYTTAITWMETSVNNNCTLFNPIFLNKFSFTYSTNNNVSLFHKLR